MNVSLKLFTEFIILLSASTICGSLYSVDSYIPMTMLDFTGNVFLRNVFLIGFFSFLKSNAGTQGKKKKKKSTHKYYRREYSEKKMSLPFPSFSLPVSLLGGTVTCFFLLGWSVQPGSIQPFYAQGVTYFM